MRRASFIIGALCLCAQEVVIRTTVPLILVPASVTDRRGKPVDGLTASDFEVFDNGKRVEHRLETSNQAIALVVAVQTSRSVGPVLAKVQKIGSMFEPLVVGEGGVAAILTYSDEVKVLQEFTHDAGDFTKRMRKIVPDGGSARMHDAVIQAVEMLKARNNVRRVLVLIGESRDRGSQAKLQDVVTKAQAANVTVYPVTYSVYKTSFTSRGSEHFEGTDTRVYNSDDGNLLAVFSEIARLGTQNGGEALAKFTGGEKLSFAKLSGLEHVIALAGEDLHSQYLLSFQSTSAEPNVYHQITVNMNRAGTTVRARPGYWSE